MEFHIEHTWVLSFLWAGPALTVCLILLRLRREGKMNRMISARMQALIRCGPTRSLRSAQDILIGIAALLIIFCLSGPGWGTAGAEARRRSRDIVVLLDVSRSMLAEDVHPSRLERVKSNILDLLDELRGDRVAVVAFRGRAATICPMTTDYAFARQAVELAGVHCASPGPTDIGEGIRAALSALGDSAAGHSAIILVSDGEDLAGTYDEAARQAASRTVPIFCVGIGSRAGAKIPDSGGYLRHAGRTVLTRLLPDSLLKIQNITGGAYIPFEQSAAIGTTLGTLYRTRISRIAARRSGTVSTAGMASRYRWFLLPAVLCLSVVMATCIRFGPLRLPRAMTPSVAVLIPALAVTLSSTALSTTRSGTMPDTSMTADEAFLSGRYAPAASLYEEEAAETGDGDRKDRHMYNAAVAFYNARDYSRSAEILIDLARRSHDTPDTAELYNTAGAALYHSADAGPLPRREDALRRAAECFMRSARIRPDDSEYSRNFAAAIARLHQIETTNDREQLERRYAQTTDASLARTIYRNQLDITARLASAAARPAFECASAMKSASAAQRRNAEIAMLFARRIENRISAGVPDRFDRDVLLATATNAAREMESAAQSLEQFDKGQSYISVLKAEELSRELSRQFGPETDEPETGPETRHSPTDKLPRNGAGAGRPDREPGSTDNADPAPETGISEDETRMMLRAVLDREKQYRIDRMKRRYAPLRAIERDW